MSRQKYKLSEEEKAKRKAEQAQRRADRELQECMRCRFFWGNNHRCELEHCYKEKEQKPVEKKLPAKCHGCGYSQGGYCFPCMKDLLGK